MSAPTPRSRAKAKATTDREAPDSRASTRRPAAAKKTTAKKNAVEKSTVEKTAVEKTGQEKSTVEKAGATRTGAEKAGEGSAAAATPRRRSSGARKELVERQILDRATALFAERGFAGTSLQDIAEASGLTRPALYYYFSSKEELLVRLVRETTMDVAEQLEALAAEHPDLAPDAHLRALVRTSTAFQARHRDQFRLLLRSEAELPDDVTELYTDGRRRVLRAYQAVIERGISAGLFRPVNSRTATLGLIGMVNWMTWWSQPDDDVSAIADEFAELAVASVLLHCGRDEAPASVHAVLAMLKDDISLLEHRLGEIDPS
ncbi:transcriptional regulator, TetR family [Lentzea fradiae]|uniref:Transcriptional regulator, TetR family n=1 Tax=Lentzea fradiae TaxID=200378 RepID=A0A1G7LB99_9PSEU|nr:TetR/AcrR family transcriptional regulator [Lentzea fradiae]SDF46797.1 transcriptional regulator, TetR family [Lentzea fradiae]